MLGHSHALSGLAAGAATLPWAPVHGTVAQMSWIAAAGGFAMLPDLDHRGSTVSDMWGPVTDVPSGIVGKLFGVRFLGTLFGVTLLVTMLFFSALADRTRLRLINLLGAASFAVYGLLIEAYPVFAVNLLIVGINIFYLRKMLSTREYFDLVEVAPDSDYLRTFLDFYEEQIERFFPGFSRPAGAGARRAARLPAAPDVHEEHGRDPGPGPGGGLDAGLPAPRPAGARGPRHGAARDLGQRR